MGTMGKGTGTERKLFTIEEANKMLPLVRPIVNDIMACYKTLVENMEALQQSQGNRELQDKVENARDHLNEVVDELLKLGLQLKDYQLGLIDFPSLRDGKDVLLCWHAGEDRVTQWHDLESGFAGRQPV